MKYYAALLSMKDREKNTAYRPQHVDFLIQMEKEGKIFARGRFMDEAGGLVIYLADSLEKAKEIAGSDPYVTCGARTLELHEWDMKLAR
jgi:uncharacterized protein YciI